MDVGNSKQYPKILIGNSLMYYYNNNYYYFQLEYIKSLKQNEGNFPFVILELPVNNHNLAF